MEWSSDSINRDKGGNNSSRFGDKYLICKEFLREYKEWGVNYKISESKNMN